MNKNNKVIGLIIFCWIIIICLVYLYSKGTYTLYESNPSTGSELEIANWDIIINCKNSSGFFKEFIRINDYNPSNNYDLAKCVNWNNEHVASNKVAPGTKGTIDIQINPGETDVAFRYDINFVDNSIDSDYILTITNVTYPDSSFVNNGSNNYFGYFKKNDLETMKVISLDVEWVNDDNIEDSWQNNNDKFLGMSFSVIQNTNNES